MTIIFFTLIAATIFFMIKPHLLNKSKHINNPVSRKKVFIIGLVSLFITLFGFGSVMAVTEPENVKQERITRELNEEKANQAKLQQEAEQLRIEEASKPVTKTEIKKEVIPFDSVEQDDSSIALGEKRISVAGVNGERTITYNVTYVNNAETERVEVKNEVTIEPVAQITLVGTYVYVAPAQSSATTSYSTTSGGRTGAICNDGSSSTATGSGACSHHGGVSYWLY